MLKPIYGLALPLLAAGSMGCPATHSQRIIDAPLTADVCDAAEDLETCRVEHVGPMNLGWLAGGVPIGRIIERLGPPDEVGELYEEEASGLKVQDHIWNARGVIVLAAESGQGLVVDRFTVRPPFDQKTARGVGLGSTEAEVIKAYGPVADPHFTAAGEQLVAGSVFGGIFFYFEDGKVTSMFVGAGAE